MPRVEVLGRGPAGHPTQEQKKNQQQMACVGCVSTVDRHVRTPEELVATLFREDDRPHETHRRSPSRNGLGPN